MGPNFRGSCAAAWDWIKGSDWAPCHGLPSYHDRSKGGMLIIFFEVENDINKTPKQKNTSSVILKQIPEINLLAAYLEPSAHCREKSASLNLLTSVFCVSYSFQDMFLPNGDTRDL